MAGIVQRARDEGMQQGIERGLSQGIERGLSQGIERGLSQGIERGLSQGIERGLSQGISQGRVEGERALLRRQLRRRFGSLSPETVARVGRASVRDLECWAENVLDAGTLDEVFESNH